jgi:peroxiredoxin
LRAVDSLKPVLPGLRQGTLEYMGAARQNELLRAGHRAPDFSLARLVNGAVEGTADLGKLLSGGPALLAFFKSTCPVCQMTLPFLERIHRGRAPGSLGVFGVSQDDAGTTQEFAGEFGISFPLLLDTEESGYPASNAYSISHVPSLVLVERNRTIAWSLEGFNRRELLAVSSYAGMTPFLPGENVPEWKAG